MHACCPLLRHSQQPPTWHDGVVGPLAWCQGVGVARLQGEAVTSVLQAEPTPLKPAANRITGEGVWVGGRHTACCTDVRASQREWQCRQDPTPAAALQDSLVSD